MTVAVGDRVRTHACGSPEVIYTVKRVDDPARTHCQSGVMVRIVTEDPSVLPTNRDLLLDLAWILPASPV